MRSKKNWYFAWVLVFVLLVCAGCKKDEEMSVQTDSQQLRGERDLIEETIAYIQDMMDINIVEMRNKVKKRSLARKILGDHISLNVLFQLKKYHTMSEVMGDNTELWLEGDENNKVNGKTNIQQFWKDRYEEKMVECPDAAFLELVFWSEGRINLTNIDPPQNGVDCTSVENFRFAIIAIDAAGDPISNQSGGGSTGRDHSEDCPWI